MDQHPNSQILALDIGAVRVGVATANTAVRLARSLDTLDHDEHIYERITSLCKELSITELVCGLPRGLDGQETSQTRYARDFAARLPNTTGLPVYLIDEALTSAQAKTELESRGKPYRKGDVDALAATYILEDYLSSSQDAEEVFGK